VARKEHGFHATYNACYVFAMCLLLSPLELLSVQYYNEFINLATMLNCYVCAMCLLPSPLELFSVHAVL